MALHRDIARQRRRARGAAVVEFALVVPMLITMLLFSMYFVELLRAKLKLQEAGRYAAWEMTSYVLTDYGGTAASRHDLAFNEARDKTLLEVNERYRDMDSVDEKAPTNGLVGYSGVTFQLRDQEVPAFDAPISLSGSGSGGGQFAGQILGAVNGGAAWVLRTWGFNPKGQVQAEVTMALDNYVLPQNFMNDSKGLFTVDQWGGRSLQSLRLRNRFTLVATGWHLPDGADAQMRMNNGGPRAGLHRGNSEHGMHRQVERMVFLGITKSLAGIPGFDQIRNVLGFAAPNPFGTFVVAHNYGLQPNNRGLRECTTSSGQGDPGHPAQDGLNNIQKYASLDHDRRRCYDTAPFRDQADYDDSQYIEIFKARGQYFMGCKQPMADDPTEPGPPASSSGDKNNKKVSCETP